MQPNAQPLIPGNDADRVQALSRYQVTGTAPEHLFDSLVSLTAKLFNAPIALLSLVEEDSVWFKANFGLPDARRLARTESLCSVAILQQEATVFDDLRQQPCTLIDPRIGQQLDMQFYAGHPLQTADGFNIGALCIIDRKARYFSSDQQQLLKQLSITVMLLLELRLSATLNSQQGHQNWSVVYTAVHTLIHRLTMLAEVGSRGQAVDLHGTPISQTEIYQEAGQLAAAINEVVGTVLAEDPAQASR